MLRSLDIQLVHVFTGVIGHSSTIDSIVLFFAEYFPFAVGGAFFVLVVVSAYSRRQQLQIFGDAILSGIIARVIVEGIRSVYQRPRPFLTEHTNQLLSLYSSSFPSGHAAFFFGFAFAIYQHNRRWGIWFLIAAAIISLARIMAGVHYPSDILAGAILGILVAYALTKSVTLFSTTTANRKSSRDTD